MRATRAVAVAAVACVAAVSACTTTPTSQPPPVTLPTGAALSAPGAVPRYYVVVAGLEVVVRASGDGHVTGSVAIPVAPGNARADVAAEAFGGPDDRHFVILVSRGGDLPGVADVSLFLLTVSPDGRPGGLSQLDFDNMGMPVIGAALSPDGTILALSLAQEFLPPVYGKVELLNVQTGKTRTWTAQAGVITPGGGHLIVSSCRAGHHTATAQVIELSAADGRLVRVLRTQTARFGNDADANDAVFSTCQVLSVASSAQVLVQAFALGRIDNGSFTPLPGTSPDVLPVSAAW